MPATIVLQKREHRGQTRSDHCWRTKGFRPAHGFTALRRGAKVTKELGS